MQNRKVENKIITIGQAHKINSQSGIVYDRHGMMVTLIAGTHGYAMGYVLRNMKKIDVIGNYHNHDASRIVDKRGVAHTVKENHGIVTATVRKWKKGSKCLAE